jgi:integrase
MVRGGSPERDALATQMATQNGEAKMAIHVLTKRDVERIRRENDGRDHHDGGNLILRGNRFFVQWRRGKKRPKIGIGLAHRITLDEAREIARETMRLVDEGKDPRVVRAEKIRLAVPVPTFREVAVEFIEKKVRGVPRHVEAYHRDLTGKLQNGKAARVNHAAAIQSMPVDKIRTQDILKVLEPIWVEQHPTAERMRGRIEDVLDYARGKGLTPVDAPNPARWKKHLETLLLARKDAHTVANQPMIDWRAAPALMAALRAREGVGFRAVELTAFTALRTGDVLGLRAKDVDLSGGVLTVEKTKMGWPLVVPLAPAAAALLETATSELAPTDRVFPLAQTGMRKALKAMAADGVAGADSMTVHGLRSTFRTWSADVDAAPEDVVETCLAHKRKGVMRVYNRAEMVERRRRVLEAWAAHLAGEGDGNVVPLRLA